jgi:mRNA interferase HicA
VKKRDLEKKLGDLRWRFLRAGGKHDVWTNGEMEEFIPRHKEIGEGLAKKILKTAKENPGEWKEGGDIMFRGYVHKDGKFWMIEVPDLDLMTQGHTKDEAYEMLVDLLKTATNRKGFRADIARHRNNTFLLRGRDEQSERDLIALLLKRQRARAGLSLSDMARLLKAKSKNAYARYEHGESVPSTILMERMLRVMGLNIEMRIRSKDYEDESTVG